MDIKKMSTTHILNALNWLEKTGQDMMYRQGNIAPLRGTTALIKDIYGREIYVPASYKSEYYMSLMHELDNRVGR